MHSWKKLKVCKIQNILSVLGWFYLHKAKSQIPNDTWTDNILLTFFMFCKFASLFVIKYMIYWFTFIEHPTEVKNSPSLHANNLNSDSFNIMFMRIATDSCSWVTICLFFKFKTKEQIYWKTIFKMSKHVK